MNSSLRTSLIVGLLVLSVVILALSLWRKSARLEQIRKENERLVQQERALEQRPVLQQTTSVQPEVSPEKQALGQPPVASTGTAQAVERPEQRQPAAKLVPTPTGYAPEPRASGLVLAGTHTAPTADGLTATMRFNPNTTEPLGIVAVVVRLPRTGSSRILDLNLTNSAGFSDIAKRVSEDGKFAVFQGNLNSATAVELTLSVSGAAVADVRGTCGIGPLELDIGPSGASANPK